MQAFIPQWQCRSHPTNKPLSCGNNVNDPFNPNQNAGGVSSSMETISKLFSQEYIK